MDVGRVPAEQQAANPQAPHHPAVDAEPRAPTHVPELRRDARALVVDRLQFRERRRRVLARPAERVAGHQAPAPVAHGEHAQEAVRGGEDVEIALREFAIDVQVAQGVLLVASLPLERKVEGGPDGAVRAVGSR